MSRPFLWIISGAVGLALIVWMAFAIASEPTENIYDDITVGWGDVTIDGDPLPQLQDETADPAIGTVAANVTGSDWNGNSYTIGADGRPKLIVFLAHWCSHCQAEVPRIVSWAEAGLAPTDVDIYSVTTLTNPTRGEWPPQQWLEDERWDFPVIMDDANSTVASYYGLFGTPLYVVLDGDNNVVFRIDGEIGIAAFEELIGIARAAA